MNVAKAGLVALVLAMLFACASDPGETSAPPAGIPHPELAELEPPLARGLEARRAGLDALLADEAATAVDQAQAFGELGRLYQAHRLLEAAHACYREAHALDLRSDDAPTLIRVADLELEQGRIEQAELLYERAAALDDSAASAYGLGRVAEERAEYAVAIEYFERALTLQPGATVIHYHLGQAYREQSRFDAAEQALARSGTARVAMADPLMHELTTLAIGASPHLTRGNAAAREGRLAEAEAAYRQAVAADATNPRAHQSLATVLVRRGNPQAALEHFGVAVRLEPENARAHSDLGVLLGELGRNDRALENLGRALELEPELVEARLSLGNVQARLGRFDDAEATYRRVLENDTGNGEARLGLGAVLAQAGNFEQAAVELQEALRHEPGDERASRIRFGLAEALVRTGRIEEALPHYTRVREIEPAQGLAWLREATG